MDPLERAISNLKSQREQVAERRLNVVRNHDVSDNPGEERRLGNLIHGYDARLEVIDYVLNILQNLREE